MVAAARFVDELGAVDRVRVELFGSLALTGRGHGTDRAVLLGLAGFEPATVPAEAVTGVMDTVRASNRLRLGNGIEVAFDLGSDLVLTPEFRPEHPNVVEFVAFRDGAETVRAAYASVGGGFVVDLERPDEVEVDRHAWPEEYRSAAQLLDLAEGRSIAAVALANEVSIRSEADVLAGVGAIASTMLDTIERGLKASGMLPGGLNVSRRARDLELDLREHSLHRTLPPTEPTDLAGVWAIAVNEENAAGHRVVTAPTNGAAGIVPAVMRFMLELCTPRVDEPVVVFLLTATAIGSLLKANAGISGAELGCQGEVGSACAMAAAGLAAALGGTPMQVENAAEIAVEHNLGLTCDPVAGLVQVPCIERNAVGAVKAITAASLALRGTGQHLVSLDAAIETMRQTGLDMDHRYKETSLGGLAVNVPAC
jgi:L-serine dehydratase